MSAKIFNYGLYALGPRETEYGQLRYGNKEYKDQEERLLFIAPAQDIAIQPILELFPPKVGHCAFIPI